MGVAAHESMRPMSIRASFEHFWETHAAAAEGVHGAGTIERLTQRR